MTDETPATEGRPESNTRLGGLLPGLATRFPPYVAQMLVPVLLVTAVAVFAALHVLRPAPPSSLTMAGGPPGSRFDTVAQRYRKILARNGITLKVVTTAGSLDNLQRMLAARPSVDVALVQTGTTAAADGDELTSLGSVFYEPLTIFYRSPAPMARLSQLRGLRVAVGPPGSGTRFLALALLKANEIEAGGPTQLLELEGEAARTALLHGQVDAVFLAGDSAGPETTRELLHAPGVRLFDFPQADAYVRRFHYLSKLEIPPGAFDLGENLPPAPTSLVAPTVELLAHPDLHPALSDLLIEAAIEVHGHAGLLQSAGEFPTPAVHDFPISADAARYYKSGKSFSYRYLPFWLASMLNRAVVVLVPVFLVLIPALRYLPAVYSWRIMRRINRGYGQLMALERQSLEDVSPKQRAKLLDRLAQIEKNVIGLKIPGSHADQLYVLREHVQFVRENLARSERQGGEAAATTAPPAA